MLTEDILPVPLSIADSDDSPLCCNRKPFDVQFFSLPSCKYREVFRCFFFGGGGLSVVCCVSFCRIRHISAQTSLDPLPPDLSLSRLLLPRGHFRDFPLFPSLPLFPSPRTVFWSASRLKPRVEEGRDQENGGGISLTLSSLPLCVPLLFRFLSLSHTHTFFCPPAISPHFPNGSVNRKKPPNHREKKPLAGPKARERELVYGMDGWIQFGGPPFPTKNTRFADPSLPSFQFPNTHRPLASTTQKEIPDPAIGCGGTIHPSSSSITQLSKLPHHNRDHPKHIISVFPTLKASSFFPSCSQQLVVPCSTAPPSLHPSVAPSPSAAPWRKETLVFSSKGCTLPRLLKKEKPLKISEVLTTTLVSFCGGISTASLSPG